MSHLEPPISQKHPKPKKKSKKKKSLWQVFLTVLATVLGLFAVMLSVTVWAYNHFNESDADVQAVAKEIKSNLKQGGSLSDLFSGIKLRTNFLLIGVDEEGGEGARTDVLVAGSYNNKTKEISLISIPRDTLITMPPERRKTLESLGLFVPKNGEMKINAVSHYATEKYGTEFVVKQVEELLQIKLEYYAKINLAAFRDLVDEIGGVTFNVPQRMYYNDPEQKLFIDLMPGEQILSGKMAEGVVRYRRSDIKDPKSKGYPEGDLGRVRVQQDFLRALISQLLSSEKIIDNIEPMAKTAFKYVRTNLPITDIPKYIAQAKGLSGSSIKTYTLPGQPTSEGISFYIPDAVAIRTLVDSIFYDNLEENTNQ